MHSSRPWIAFVFAPAIALSSFGGSGYADEARTVLPSSIRPTVHAQATTSAVTQTDLNETMDFSIALQMRNRAELDARTARGEIVSFKELAEKYQPLKADSDKIAAWLKAQGFTVLAPDPMSLAVFASGTVAQVQNAFQVSFTKVAAEGRTFTTAVNAPSLPAALAPGVLSINGLQPDLHPHKNAIIMPPGPHPLTGNRPPFLTGEILKAYDGTGLAVNGSGQKIAIVIDTFPKKTDLTAFWTACGVTQNLNNIEFVQVVPGTLPAPSGEETLDVEWASGIAPSAKVRVYASHDLAFTSTDKVYQAILNDVPTQPQMHQVSISLGLGEGFLSLGQLQTDSNFFSMMAAAGLSVMVSSGDSGSNEGGQLQVSYFASDPNVTAIGGTSLTLNTGNGTVSGETAWSGSGGGVSLVFDRPSWQTGAGVTAGTKRLVPDISATADPNTGALVILNGQQQQIGGTSWSAPTWGGYCALINQARNTLALQPLGLLGPRIYPLGGSANIKDITAGSNGAYSAGTGYDRVTGLGVPDVKNLIQTLGGNVVDLTLAKPANWSDRIVVSKKTGTTTDDLPLSYMDNLFVDFSVVNVGGIATNMPFAVDLQVDGTTVTTVTVPSPFAANGANTTTDFALGMLTRGTHTITVNIDTANAITESDETNNVFNKTIFIIGDPPVVTTTVANLTYTENDPATPADAGIIVTDGDSPTLAGATVTLTTNFVSGQDMLFYDPADGITGTFDPVTGILPLIGDATPDAYQAALRRVKYINFSDNPSVQPRTVSFTVNDGGSSTTATRKITVVAVNDAPIPTSVNVLTNEDTPIAFKLTGTDAENSALTFTVTQQPQHGKLTGTVPNVTYTPDLNYNGSDSFTFNANDGQLTSVSDATVSITVVPVNDAPLADAQIVNTNEDLPATITLTGSDVENSPITFSIATGPAHGTLSGTPPNVTYQPDALYFGNDIFTFTTNDGELTSAPATVSITVNRRNHAPTFTVGPDQVVIDTAAKVVPNWATNIDQGVGDTGQTVTFNVQADQPALFQAQPAVASDGTLTFRAAVDAVGIATVTIVAHDNGGVAFGGVDTSAPQTFKILINPPNFAPIFTAGPDVLVAEDSGAYAQPWATNISAGAPHESAQVLNFILQFDHPEIFSVPPTISPAGVLSFTPAAGQSGLSTVTVKLHDNGGTVNGGVDTSAPQTFTIAVSTFIEEAGTYNGLIMPVAGATPEQDRFGVAKVTITTSGSITAKVEVGGRSYSVKGRVDRVGSFLFGKLLTPTAELVRPGLDSLNLGLLLDVSKGTDKLAGTITVAGQPFAVLDADRALYTSKSNPEPPFLNPPSTLPGKYTAIFGAQTPAAQGLSPDLYPQGDGIAFITVSTAGTVKVTGTLADGSKVSVSNSLSKKNVLPFRVLTDSKKGSLTGPITFEDAPKSDLDASDITWIKPINPNAKSYPSGWENGIGVDVLGSVYSVPAGQPALPGLGAPGVNGNANVALSIGGLAIGGLPNDASIDAQNRVLIVLPPSGANTDKLSLKINAKTGAITGSFIFPVSNRKTNISGIILRKSARGAGFFISDLASGHFSLEPKP